MNIAFNLNLYILESHCMSLRDTDSTWERRKVWPWAIYDWMAAGGTEFHLNPTYSNVPGHLTKDLGTVKLNGDTFEKSWRREFWEINSNLWCELLKSCLVKELWPMPTGNRTSGWGYRNQLGAWHLSPTCYKHRPVRKESLDRVPRNHRMLWQWTSCNQEPKRNDQ